MPKENDRAQNPKWSAMSRWDQAEYVVVDLEGSGSGPDQKIVEIGACLIRGGRIENEGFYRLLNPEVPISPMASSIHGIYDRDVAEMPVLDSVEKDFHSFAHGRILVAHNAGVERRLLQRNLPSIDFPYVLDTLKLSRFANPEQGRHTLDDLITRFGIGQATSVQHGSRRHRADYDASATAHAFLSLVARMNAQRLLLIELLNIASLPSAQSGTDDASQGGLSEQTELF